MPPSIALRTALERNQTSKVWCVKNVGIPPLARISWTCTSDRCGSVCSRCFAFSQSPTSCHTGRAAGCGTRAAVGAGVRASLASRIAREGNGLTCVFRCAKVSAGRGRGRENQVCSIVNALRCPPRPRPSPACSMCGSKASNRASQAVIQRESWSQATRLCCAFLGPLPPRTTATTRMTTTQGCGNNFCDATCWAIMSAPCCRLQPWLGWR